MNRRALSVLSSLVTLLLTGACTSPATTSSNPAAASSSPAAASSNTGAMRETAKPGAPVAVNAQLSDGQAQVTVRFEAPASDVKVNVYGIDGLVVKSPATPVDGASFVKDAVATFDVAFNPGAGRSNLVVAVTGSFPGGPRSSVSTFAVGSPTPEQQKTPGTVTTGEDGERIKVLPANGQ